MPSWRPTRRRALAAAALGCLAIAVAGCASTGRPAPISRSELAEARTFPYFRVYWVGSNFDGSRLSAADGLHEYMERIGDSVYYGDCVKTKGIFGGGSCQLPLQVTTVIYHWHSNGPLGPQSNIVVRGVPATVYDKGHSIEVYTGRTAVDIFSDTYAHALAAAERLLPINAPGSASEPLPPPIYCPGLSGVVEGEVSRVIASLPHRACQEAQAQQEFKESLKS
jgi:hypothetical protein